MLHITIPPFYIVEEEDHFTVNKIQQGYNFRINPIKSFDSLDKAKKYLKTLLQESNAYKLYQVLGYKGTEEDFFEFCCNK